MATNSTPNRHRTLESRRRTSSMKNNNVTSSSSNEAAAHPPNNRRSFTYVSGFTEQEAAYFDDPHHADPVDSVYGGGGGGGGPHMKKLPSRDPSLAAANIRHSYRRGGVSDGDYGGSGGGGGGDNNCRRPSSRPRPSSRSRRSSRSLHSHSNLSNSWEADHFQDNNRRPSSRSHHGNISDSWKDLNSSKDDTTTDYDQNQQQTHPPVEYWGSSSDQTEGLTMSDPSDDDIDEDEDNCEEHYRQLPPRKFSNDIPTTTTTTCANPEPYRMEQQERQIVLSSQRQQQHPATRSSIARNQQLDPEEQKGAAVAVDKNLRLEPRSRSSSRPRMNNQLAIRRDDATTPDPPAYSVTQNKYYNDQQQQQHRYITVEEEHRFLVLYTFLKLQQQQQQQHNHTAAATAPNNKGIIFFSTTESTRYHAKLLQRLKFENVHYVHDKQGKERFLDEFLQFSKSGGKEGGILCVPDFRGNDSLAIPHVTCSWIVQFEPCADPGEYPFRAGRICSNDGNNHGGPGGGSSPSMNSPHPPPPKTLLFLTPSQFGFLRYFKAARVKISEYEIPQISNMQKDLTCRIREDVKLTKLATEAYHAYLAAYAANSREYGDIYDVRAMDPEKVACCFGFDRVPSSKVGNNSNYNNDKINNTDGYEKVEKMVVNKEADNNNNMALSVQDRVKTTMKEQAAATKMTTWKPKKHEKQSWMTRDKKTWKYANVHAKTTGKGGTGSNGKNEFDHNMPKTIKLRGRRGSYMGV